eukprot:CAMPEP_0174235970 /NCGR_PEP_ID=MMETSP0417-20130205/5249_1 /TAXON_ID=242541 /ORGANISM="Mayorella sp, Strain BSH-02190019" /LENGTH=377 /DNA_ID=CAMNT_0015314557 /DNA_START=179 /DNA_END=1309 /DNA_ORIENTATION=+
MANTTRRRQTAAAESTTTSTPTKNNSNTSLKKKKKKKVTRLTEHYAFLRTCEEYYGSVARLIVAIILGLYTYGVEEAREYVILPYPTGNGTYAKGIHDLKFIFFYLCVFLSIRDLLFRFVLLPLARLTSVAEKDQIRFCEQSWLTLYFVCSFTMGAMVLEECGFFADPEKWADLTVIYKGSPVLLLSLMKKSFYLLAAAFWLHCLLTVFIEEKRKDFVEMVVHHFVTLGLISFSYLTHWTMGGIMVYVLMDFSDIFLSLAKACRYANIYSVGYPAFALFVISFPITRLAFYGRVVWGIIFHPIPYLIADHGSLEACVANGCVYSSFLHLVLDTLLVLLLILQVRWFYMIIRLLIRSVKTGGEPEDIREADWLGKKTW